MAKNVVYIANQYDPVNSFLFFISAVMWMMFRETLTQAAAHANDRGSPGLMASLDET